MQSNSSLMFSKGEDFVLSLTRALGSKENYHAIVVELEDSLARLSLEIISLMISAATRILGNRGVLLVFTADGAITFSKEDLSAGVLARSFDSPEAVLARFPAVGSAMSQKFPYFRRHNPELVLSLYEHVLLTSVPIRIEDSKKESNSGSQLTDPERRFLELADGFSSVEKLIVGLEKLPGFRRDDAMAILDMLERKGEIYPLFARAEFLAGCYKNKRPFRLGHYMVVSGILSHGQLEVLLERQAEQEAQAGHKPMLGELVVKAGLASQRLVETLLEDQYYFGGSQMRPPDVEAGPIGRTLRDSMMGSLSTIDASALLQSVSTASKDGMLIVENEYEHASIQIKFVDGRIVAAVSAALEGVDAITDFLAWNDGIFVFREQDADIAVSESCKISYSLDKILLDAALCQDLMEKIYSELPAGRDTILERVFDFEQKWQGLDKNLELIDETKLTEGQWKTLELLALKIDGMATLQQIVDRFRAWPKYMSLYGIHALIQQKLLVSNQSALTILFGKFVALVKSVEETTGRENNVKILSSSLNYTFEKSALADCVRIGPEGKPEINLPRVKEKGISVSNVVTAITRWMHTYVAYCRNLNIEVPS